MVAACARQRSEPQIWRAASTLRRRPVSQSHAAFHVRVRDYAEQVLAGDPCDEAPSHDASDWEHQVSVVCVAPAQVGKCIAADVFALGLVLWLMCTGAVQGCMLCSRLIM